jgi:hypothetical protein
MNTRTLAASALLSLASFVGCSEARPSVEMIEVSGRVSLKGRPVARMIMNLTPVSPGEGREDQCVVESGEYRVKLICGRYNVSFTPCPGGPSVPARYRTAEEAELTLDGTRPENADFDLK